MSDERRNLTAFAVAFVLGVIGTAIVEILL